MLSNCPNCGKLFKAVGARKYCCDQCKEEARLNRKKPKEKICPYCGITFMPKSNRQVYCSKEHRNIVRYSKDKQKRKDAVYRYIDRKKFGGNRELALQRDGYKCVICGGNIQLGVHHKDRSGQTDNPNHELDNLISLCNKCHIHEHLDDLKQPKTSYWTTCQYCGKPFKTTPFKVANGGGKYHSAKCANAARVMLDKDFQEELTHSLTKPNWIVVTCSNPACGIEFEVPPNRVKRSLEKHGEIILYHCRSCRTAVENHKRAKPKPEKPIKPIPKEGYKFCIKCGEELPANETFFHRRVDNGVLRLKNICKRCANSKTK